MRVASVDLHGGRTGWAVRLDPRAKLVGILAFLAVLVTTPPGAPKVFPGLAATVLLLLVAARVPLLPVLARSLVILPLVLAVAIAAPFLQFPESSTASPFALLVVWSVFNKAFLGVCCTLWLTAVTPLPLLLDAFARLRVPGILVLIAGFVYRYLFLIAEEVVHMKRGLDARGFRGHGWWRVRTLGHVAGTLFLRSYERAERTYGAMLARGFQGGAPALAARPWHARDCFFPLSLSILAITIRVVLQ